ncbi:MAG: hypothetical protein EBE86_001775 [Hormoscilla sp. GUM202]|nr:hypothetical protein [Hormoscilla sp. GUM202]
MINAIYSRSEAEIELFQALCVTEYTYPWSSLTRESQTYFTELEASTASLTDRPEPEVAAGAQRFFAHLDRLWDAATPETMAHLFRALKSFLISPNLSSYYVKYIWPGMSMKTDSPLV